MRNSRSAPRGWRAKSKLSKASRVSECLTLQGRRRSTRWRASETAASTQVTWRRQGRKGSSACNRATLRSTIAQTVDGIACTRQPCCTETGNASRQIPLESCCSASSAEGSTARSRPTRQRPTSTSRASWWPPSARRGQIRSAIAHMLPFLFCPRLFDA